MEEARPRIARVERRPEEVRTPGAMLPDVRRLVVVRHDRLGDFVLTLPAIDSLRGTYPRAELAVAVSPGVRPLAERVGGVDRVLEVDSDAGGLRGRLQEFETDLVVCVSRGAAFAWAAARARVPHRIGPGHRYYSPLFERTVDEHRSAGRRHEVEYALSFAHRAGASSGPARFPLGRDGEAERAVRSWLASREVGPRFVVLHAGGGGSCPRWPLAHFLRLSELLAAEGVPVVFTLGPGDRDVEQGLSAAARAEPVFQDALPGVAALLAQASLIVGSSTGPIHLAAAQGTPTLAIHAPWPSCGVSRWGPYAANGWAVVAEAPGAAGWTRRERARGSRALMESVPPGFVHRAALALIEGRDPD